MTSEPTKPVSSSEPQTQSSGTAVPIWLLVLMFLVLYWGATYFDGIDAPKGAVSDIPKTPEIISLIRGLNKQVKVK